MSISGGSITIPIDGEFIMSHALNSGYGNEDANSAKSHYIKRDAIKTYMHR